MTTDRGYQLCIAQRESFQLQVSAIQKETFHFPAWTSSYFAPLPSEPDIEQLEQYLEIASFEGQQISEMQRSLRYRLTQQCLSSCSISYLCRSKSCEENSVAFSFYVRFGSIPDSLVQFRREATFGQKQPFTNPSDALIQSWKHNREAESFSVARLRLIRLRLQYLKLCVDNNWLGAT